MITRNLRLSASADGSLYLGHSIKSSTDPIAPVPYGALYRSNDSGKTWSQVNVFPSVTPTSSNHGQFEGFGFDNSGNLIVAYTQPSDSSDATLVLRKKSPGQAAIEDLPGFNATAVSFLKHHPVEDRVEVHATRWVQSDPNVAGTAHTFHIVYRCQ